MINSYTNTSVSANTNDLLNFNIDSVKVGCSVTHAEGTPTFSLNKPGTYLVIFNGSGAASTATTGDITVQLQNNGTSVTGAITTANSATQTTDIVSLGFATLIQVRPSCCAVNNSCNLTLINSGIPTAFSNYNLVIKKVC